MIPGEVLHDYFAVREGGGRLALTLGESWDWPVRGGFVSPDIPFRKEWPNVRLHELGVRPGTLPLQVLRLMSAWNRYKSSARIVIYSGTYTPLAVSNHLSNRNILYCHTPPRFIYDQRSFYLASLPVGQRPAFLPLVNYLERRYRKSVERMDRIVVNSENVKWRVRTYLGLDSTVVHPPCEVERYYWKEPDGYYLSTARMDSLKRVDLIVEAFKCMPDRRLMVVSSGAERKRLIELAENATNIRFVGDVGDVELKKLIAGCIATIYIPRDEDFGMSPVESMAAGKPVIGVAEGGLLETVTDGETGILLPRNPKVDHLIEAVVWLTSQRSRDMRGACERRSMAFRTEVFLDGMSSVVAEK